MMPEISERLASLEANYLAIDRRAIEHEKNDNERFSNVMAQAEENKSEILMAITNLVKKVSTLWDDKNKRSGAMDLGRYAAGIIGGIIVGGIDWFVRR